MAETGEDLQLTASQLEAQRRRNRILNNASNRMKLVVGETDELQPAPARPVASDNPPETSSVSSQKSFQTKKPVFPIFRWSYRAITAAVLFVPMFFMMFSKPPATAPGYRFVLIYFISLELFFCLLQWIHFKHLQPMKRFTNFMFRQGDKNILDDLVDLVLTFSCLSPWKAELFRFGIFSMFQLMMDLVIGCILFLISVLIFMAHNAS